MIRVLTSDILLFLALALATNHTCLGFCITQRYDVHIINNLSNNNFLGLHCWSGDDDLGTHELSPSDEFHFHFCTNVFGSTRFWCDFNWNRNQYGGRFEVFWDWPELSEMCNSESCVWSARDDGLYLLDAAGQKFVKEYIWEVAGHQQQKVSY
ncbi:S-protein homolog 1 [Ricinus communis]|uniref:S-protein homolog n=1 Tax=Ricinus communis TaxID=3988 RepID=B9T6I6_RICCO|nr:S-protein homolog 1 [Ricinus communis]EEF28530.1 conserved hypothetical protein [Ricinus communis]|eukprot:XP_002533855.1 S-protein homolog 1 [Ricinus communis]